MKPGPTIAFALTAGLIGWLWEYCKNCHVVWPTWGVRVPFLAAYSIGAVLVIAIAPKVRGWSLMAKAALYAGIMTVLETIVAWWDRHRSNGRRSWSYTPDGWQIHPKATLLWTIMALALDTALTN